MSTRESSRGVKFATTRWSLVAAAGREEVSAKKRALAELCQGYWQPLYAFVRQQGFEREAAQDITQSFILELLSKNTWAVADRELGRFRSFLLGCLKHFLSHERERQRAKKRGGSKLSFRVHPRDGESAYQAVAHEPSAEKLFERAWLNTVLQRVMQRFMEPFASKAEQSLVKELLPGVMGGKLDYRQIGETHQKTPVALRQMVSRLRKKYQELLLEEIGGTVMEPGEVQDEIRYLFSIASGVG